MQLTINEKTAALLQTLAVESNLSVEALIEKMANEADTYRHVVYVPNEGNVRINCGLSGCRETRLRPGDWRD